MKQEAGSQAAAFRQLPGVWGTITRVMLCAIPVIGILYILDVAGYLRISFFSEQYFGLMFALSFATGFLIFPATKAASENKLPWYDIAFAILSLVAGGYILVFYPRIVFTLGIIRPERVILGAIMVLSAIELVRRLYGWPLVFLGIIIILYGRFTYLVPGPLGGSGIDWERLVISLYLHPSAILGFPARVIFTIVLAFIFFGQAMFITGGGQSINNLALAAMGKYRGGPAKVAVVGSSMFGTLSGSPTANVLTTGQVTIPLMKEIGYKPTVAAAIEAVASTGGAIMPPVMGATAFLLAEFLEIPYTAVVIAALIPGILYYLAVFIQVDLEAAKNGIKGLAPQQLPSVVGALRAGWVYILPVAVLIFFLFVISLSPAKAALYSAASFFAVGAFRKETRLTPRKLLACLQNSGWITLQIGIIISIAGILIGVVGLTGAGINLSQVLVATSGGNVLLLLMLTAAASTLLGMGMPVTATYVAL
ncbi:TRAP transporter permease, partial [Chloroflexota bacterium]